MLNREDRWPLVVGFLLALAAHVGGAAGIVALRRGEVADPARPDVAVMELTSPPPRIAGEPATLRVELANQGDRSAEAVTVRAFVEDEAIATITLDAPLNPGQRIRQNFRHTVSEPGPHRVRIDAELGEPEQGEGASEADRPRDANTRNNRRERTFVWVTPEGERSAGPDLVPYELTIEEPRIAGKPVEAAVRIANIGRATSDEPVTISLRLDGEEIARHTFEGSMPAGAAHRYTRQITVEEPGEHEIAAVVDPDDQIAELDESNNATRRRAEWRAEPEEEEPVVGDEHTDPTAVSWISYEDFQKLRARQSRVDQAAQQRDVEPVPEAQQMPLNPTPPAPQTRPSDRAATAQRSAQPAAPQREMPPDQQPKPPKQPEEADQSDPAEPQRAPSVPDAPEQDELATPEEAEPRAPSEISPAGMERARPQPVVDTTPAEDPQPNPPSEAPEAPELALARPMIEPGTAPAAETEIPTPLRPERTAETAARRAPPLRPDPEADPDDRSTQVEAEAMKTPQLAAAPLPERPTEPVAAPETEDQEEPAEDRTERQPNKPVEPKEQPTDGARPEPERKMQNQQSPQRAEQRPSPQPAPDQQSNPTAAPKAKRESPPVRRVEDAKVDPGEVLARPGIKINTVQPRFSPVALRTAAPRNPDVRLVFNKKGEVLDARIVRSTGYANVDGPLLKSLYKWSAEGPRLKQIEDKLVVEIRILLVPED